ncbi:hypothetical protein B0H21DRAFT_865644 [Amylocystis lapponica]|nr:hypothetical protein B0H21DRAFT_865644 [Amylocystis lapponica]
MAHVTCTSTVNTIELLDLAESLSSRILNENHSLSTDVIWAIEDTQLEFLSLIRSSLNSRAPIHRFPAEILIIIFGFVPDTTPADSTSLWPGTYAHSCEIVALSQVCRYWHDITLGTPSLWTSIHQRGVRCMPSRVAQARLVMRSGGAPLNLHVHNSRKSLMKRVSGRIQDLTITDKAVTPGEIPNHLTFRVRRLERLVVDGSGSRSETSSAVLLFQGDAPLLRVLVLIRVNWIPSNDFPNLTHLCLSFKEPLTFRPGKCDLQALLKLLSHTSRLQELLLASTRWNTQGVGIDMTQSISLNKMHRLGFHAVPLTCAATLLSHIRLPSNISLTVTGPWKRRRKLNRVNSPILSYEFSRLDAMHSITRCRFRQEGSVPSSSIVVASSCSAIRLQMGGDKQQWVPVLCDNLPQLSGIEEFWVESALTAPKIAIRKVSPIMPTLLDAMPSLKTLLLFIHNVADRDICLRFLTDLPLRCPELTTIHIDIGDRMRLDMKALAEVVAFRAQHGHPLSQVTVDCRPHDSRRLDRVPPIASVLTGCTGQN